MKKIKCTLPISAIKIGEVYINLEPPVPGAEKVIEVDDKIARQLLKRAGFELLRIEEKVSNALWDKAKSWVTKVIGGK